MKNVDCLGFNGEITKQQILKNIMTNKNIDKLPETYTVSYYNPEIDESITLNQEQLKAINNPSEFKVINQGETYQSWKALADNPAYGPGF
jgi:hypothetical protein